MTDVDRYYPAKGRVILHVDMNAFYCSVHEAENPELYRGRMTAVAGDSEKRRGIVVTSSYPARKAGVRTGMTVHQALKLCPSLTLIKPDFRLYKAYSRAFREILYSYTPMIQATSIDECYMDITGSKQFGTPMQIAEEIQRRIEDELSLPCSIGVAPNKLLAKIASDMKKPNGISVLRIRDLPQTLWNRPCGELFGVGAKTAEKLNRLGIRTIGELAQTDEKRLEASFGVFGAWMKRAANGQDNAEVHPEREPSKSVGHTTTLPHDVTDNDEALRVLLNLSDQVARRMRRQELLAGAVQITIRTPEMKTITRSRTLEIPTEAADDIFREAKALYLKHWGADRPVRLLGVAAQSLSDKKSAAIQLDLFDYERQPKREKLTEVMDKLRDKFGDDALMTAGMLGEDGIRRIKAGRTPGISFHGERNKDEEDE
ncbi:DNA polymerase IV [Saccharibacillus sp. CPCC 101409]|uniref:DNA polymerase IV n=1 Tax=Saccharibacillus sp. CPCC 101409 TaxID=3058041 RepID=UPI00267412B7|nr:DNA polymerase IV [Saccharibacillus sp. CPCC 101409]MDO3410893.1 DNA polymerase IV [Saccharibacillus sp. CPCC 101409]